MADVRGLFGRTRAGFRGNAPISARALNADGDAAGRLAPVVGTNTGGLAAQQLPNGLAVRPVGTSAADFLTTSQITKRSGVTLGSGTAKMQRIVNGQYVDSGVELTIYSKWTDKKLDTGAYVTCLLIDNHWTLVDPDDCGHLV